MPASAVQTVEVLAMEIADVRWSRLVDRRNKV